MVSVGDSAPDFSLPDQTGTERTLSDYRGRWVLLYFYPKDNTPGCTKQACMIRDVFPRFENLHVEVFGISKDSVKSHASFAEKHDLPFKLLADEGHVALDAYGVWAEKQMMGKTYMGTLRTSFLIDPEGVVKKVYEKVKPEVHAEEVLADLKEFGVL